MSRCIPTLHLQPSVRRISPLRRLAQYAHRHGARLLRPRRGGKQRTLRGHAQCAACHRDVNGAAINGRVATLLRDQHEGELGARRVQPAVQAAAAAGGGRGGGRQRHQVRGAEVERRFGRAQPGGSRIELRAERGAWYRARRGRAQPANAAVRGFLPSA